MLRSDYFFNRPMVLEILDHCLIILAAKCTVHVVELRPYTQIYQPRFYVNGLASFATETVLRHLIF